MRLISALAAVIVLFGAAPAALAQTTIQTDQPISDPAAVAAQAKAEGASDEDAAAAAQMAQGMLAQALVQALVMGEDADEEAAPSGEGTLSLTAISLEIRRRSTDVRIDL